MPPISLDHWRGSVPQTHVSAAPAEVLAHDWMVSHHRILTFWIDRLVADDGDAALIDVLHRHSEWLGLILGRMAGER